MDWEKLYKLVKHEHEELLENTRINRLLLLESMDIISNYIKACEQGDNIDKSNAYQMLQIHLNKTNNYLRGVGNK